MDENKIPPNSQQLFGSHAQVFYMNFWLLAQICIYIKHLIIFFHQIWWTNDIHVGHSNILMDILRDNHEQDDTNFNKCDVYTLILEKIHSIYKGTLCSYRIKWMYFDFIKNDNRKS